jgi:hypothetical protein
MEDLETPEPSLKSFDAVVASNDDGTAESLSNRRRHR